MSTILYLSNQMVQVVDASEGNRRLVVKAVYEGCAPEGSIINGVVTDEEAFRPWIQDFFNRRKINKKEVALVVNSTLINNKVLEIPKLKPVETMDMIPREFPDVQAEETVFTYAPLAEEVDGNSRMRRILATAVSRDFIQNYLELFKEVGIEITSVSSAHACAVRLLMKSPQVVGVSCIVQLYDGQEMISILFVKGTYFYSQRNRIFAEKHTQAYIRETSEIINRLLQFAAAQQVRGNIECVYLCDTDEEELAKMRFEPMFADDSLRPEVFDTSGMIATQSRASAQKGKIGRFLYPIGYAIPSDPKLDLLRQMRMSTREAEQKKEKRRLFLPSIIVLAVGILGTVLLLLQYLGNKKELVALNVELDTSTQLSEEYEQTRTDVTTVSAQAKEAVQAWKHINSYPTINEEIETQMQACTAGTSVQMSTKSFSRDSGVLTIEGTAARVEDISTFIGNLQMLDLFESVEYSGYTYVKAQNNYSIHVVCCMAEGAGKQEVAQ